MGVDEGYQGQGIAKIMVIDAMRRTLLINEHMGVVGLFVDAKDNDSLHFIRIAALSSFSRKNTLPNFGCRSTRLWYSLKIENN